MTPEMRTRSPAFSDSTSASVSGVRTSLISSEGGCAPLPKPPPFDGPGEAGARSRSLIASLTCGGWGGIRFPRRGAAPPFRTSPLRWRRQRRRSDGGGDRAALPSSQRHFLVAVGVAFDVLGGRLRPPADPPPFDGAGNAGARTEVEIARRCRPHSVTSLCRCAWHSISSEGGCAPLPNLPPSMAPATPALERRGRSRSAAVLTASLPCAGARGIRFPRRGAAPPFRTSPLRWRRQRRRSDGGGDRASLPSSQRHFLVPVRVAFDFLGGGLRPPSEPPPFDGASNAGARTEGEIARRCRPHSVTSLWRWAWHSISSEGGCAPLPNLPPSMAPATPALERRGRSRGAAVLTASLPCAGARGIRFPRRGAAPPFRTSPLRWRRQRRRSNGGGDRAAQPSSQSHFLVPVGVAFDFLGGGLRPPSEPPPFDGAGNAGARTEATLLRGDRAHSVTSLCRCA